MRVRDWFRPPRHIFVIFLAVAVVSGAALGWLGWLLLEQDNAVEAERRRQHTDDAADRAVAVMQRSLTDLESQLDARVTAAAPPAGIMLVLATQNSLVVRPEAGLLYYPEPPLLPETAAGTFTEAERLEFAAHNPAAAAAIYEKLATSADSAIRAGALTRLARIRRKQHDPASAESAYVKLSQIRHAAVAGLPAGLIAREGLASLFQETHRSADLLREAAAFQADLQAGRWKITKQQYEFCTSEAAAWLGHSTPQNEDALARAEAFRWLVKQPIASQSAIQPSPVERRLIQPGRSPALVIWTHSSDRGLSAARAAIAGPQYLASLCHEAVPGPGFQWSLADLEGRTVLGQSPPARDVAIRTAAATHLPWTLHLFVSPGPSAPSQRRQILLWVFAVLAIVLSTGTYFILHSISRELRVAHLQSEFVAAVSHEFRSPLSSLSQISEMLANDRFSSDQLRRKSYDVLVRETERLRRLVEGLLDFGRFEAGAAAYRFEMIEACAFLRAIVADFQERVAPQGYTVELSVPDTGKNSEWYIRADREALTRAIWNLLDNAVKYSPECHTVWVDMEHAANRISIAVRDHGLGIPVHEQREIFNKFVRGEDSKALSIKGTGIGLAMVRHIVQAHGGEIQLASEPGQGSRFTMLLRAVAGGLS